MPNLDQEQPTWLNPARHDHDRCVDIGLLIYDFQTRQRNVLSLAFQIEQFQEGVRDLRCRHSSRAIRSG